MKWLVAITLLLVLARVWCQEIPELLQKLKEKIDPFIPIEEIQIMLRNKCKMNGGDGIFDKLKNEINDLEEYVSSSFNITQIIDEIEAVRPTQTFGLVFKKYCEKIPNFLIHLQKAFGIAAICIENEEKPLLNLLLNVTEMIATTVCFNSGDRLSIFFPVFMEYDGPGCILSQKNGLEQCSNQTLSRYFPPDFSYNSILRFDAYEIEGCSGMVKLRTCVVDALEKCEDITTGILVGALLSIIRRNLPCITNVTV